MYFTWWVRNTAGLISPVHTPKVYLMTKEWANNIFPSVRERSTCVNKSWDKEPVVLRLTAYTKQAGEAKKGNRSPKKGKKHERAREQLHTYLAPTDTRTTLSRWSLHHSSTSRAKVALNKALFTTWDVHARKIEASWSRNPVFPSSNSLSDSSTTSHSTLGTKRVSFQ